MSDLEAKIRITAQNETAAGFEGAAENAQQAAGEIERAVDAMRERLERAMQQVRDAFQEGMSFEGLDGLKDFAAQQEQIFNTLAGRGRQVFEQTRTPLEQLAAKQAELNKLLNAGALDAETHARAMDKVKQEFLSSLSPQESFEHKLKELKEAFGAGRIGAGEFKQSLSQLKTELHEAEAAAGGLEGMFGKLKGLFAGFIGVQLVQDLVQTADALGAVNNQIRMITGSEQEYAAVKAELLNVANRTYSDIEATADLYVKSSRALQDYGYTQKEILTFTEATANAMRIGGVEAQQQAAALMQLSQALGSGVLQGDEFKSIAESAPILLDTIAEYMGKSRAEIKKLGSEGKLTADVVFNAISGASDKFAAQAAKMPVSFGQAMTHLGNQWKAFIDRIMNSGAMNALATVVDFIAKHFDAFAAGLAAAAVVLMAAFMPAIVSATGAAWAFVAAILANPITWLAVAIGGAVALLVEFADEIDVFGDGMSNLSDVVQAAWEIIGEVIGSVIETVTGWFGGLTAFLNESVGGWSGLFERVMSAVLDAVLTPVNEIIGSFVTAYQAVTSAWNAGPNFFLTLGKSIANIFLSAITHMVNTAIEKINGLISFANSAAASIGLDVQIGTLNKVSTPKGFSGEGVISTEQVDSNRRRNWVGGAADGLREHAALVHERRATGANAGAAKLNTSGGSSRKAAGGGKSGGGGRKSGGGQKSGSGSSRDDRLQKWNEEIELQKLAHEELQRGKEQYIAWDVNKEIAFWQEKLKAVAEGSKANIDIRKKLIALYKGLDKERLEENRRALSEQEKIRLHHLEIEEEAARQAFEAAQTAQTERIDAEIEFENRRYQIKRESLLRMAELEEAAGNQDKAAQTRSQIAELDRKHGSEQQKLGGRRSKARRDEAPTMAEMLQDGGKSVWKEAENAMGQAFNAMLTRTKSFRQAIGGMFKAIGQSFMQEMVQKPLMAMMQRAVQETSIYQMIFNQKGALEAAAKAKTTALKSEETLEVVGGNAVQAASGAAASQAGIPYVGPILAVAAMGAMMAAVMGLIGGGGESSSTTVTRIPSAAGGWDIPSGINPLTQLHENEMVLPAEHAQTIRDMAGQGGGGETVIINTTGGDFIHKKDLAKMLKQLKRDFKFV